MNNETVSSCLWVFHFKYIPHSVHQNSYTLLFKFIFIAYSILFHSRQFCFNSLSNLLEILRIHKHIIHRWFGICYPPFLFWFFFLFSFGQVSTYLYHPFHTKSFTLWSHKALYTLIYSHLLDALPSESSQLDSELRCSRGRGLLEIHILFPESSIHISGYWIIKLNWHVLLLVTLC